MSNSNEEIRNLEELDKQAERDAKKYTEELNEIKENYDKDKKKK